MLCFYAKVLSFFQAHSQPPPKTSPGQLLASKLQPRLPKRLQNKTQIEGLNNVFVAIWVKTCKPLRNNIELPDKHAIAVPPAIPPYGEMGGWDFLP